MKAKTLRKKSTGEFVHVVEHLKEYGTHSSKHPMILNYNITEEMLKNYYKDFNLEDIELVTIEITIIEKENKKND